MLLTSLAKAQPAERIIDLYRHRWQVEIGIKRLKTLGGLDELPTADPVLSRTWLLAQLIAAVLTDDLANEIVGFPPSAGRAAGRAAIDVACLGEGERDLARCHSPQTQADLTRRADTVSPPP